MARRAAPPGSGPSYYTPAPAGLNRSLADPNESFFSRFLREQILAPEKLPGNLSIATGLGVFLGGIFVVRRWGQLLVPA
ncbi:hypothetical protein K488DRAFT_47304 [Vararia minispora EC-137]|uniref:Uncharacterized protein n=1 Tax=Vararia minispora EC-137 TaxID=1314806 RepID=A0ACB8QPK8_9AGAM|nr:hypothetical protein K488DRAFT_47304 [Vararia minispora EC-137]